MGEREDEDLGWVRKCCDRIYRVQRVQRPTAETETYFSLAWASEGTVWPFPLAYMTLAFYTCR